MSGVFVLAIIFFMVYIAIRLERLTNQCHKLEDVVVCSIAISEVPPDDREPWER